MRDPELVFKAQLAASALERAWQRWRVMHGLVADPMPAISSYVGYSLEEPWGQPRVVFGLSAKDAEQLATLLNRHDCIGPVHAGIAGKSSAGQAGHEAAAGSVRPLPVPPQAPSVVAEQSGAGDPRSLGKAQATPRRPERTDPDPDGPVYRQVARAAREAARQAAANQTTSAAQPSTERPSAERPSVEQAPVERAPVERAPVERPSVEQAPGEQAPGEQAALGRAGTGEAKARAGRSETASAEPAPASPEPTGTAKAEPAPSKAVRPGSASVAPGVQAPTQAGAAAAAAVRESDESAGKEKTGQIGADPTDVPAANKAREGKDAGSKGSDGMGRDGESREGKDAGSKGSDGMGRDGESRDGKGADGNGSAGPGGDGDGDGTDPGGSGGPRRSAPVMPTGRGRSRNRAGESRASFVAHEGTAGDTRAATSGSGAHSVAEGSGSGAGADRGFQLPEEPAAEVHDSNARAETRDASARAAEARASETRAAESRTTEARPAEAQVVAGQPATARSGEHVQPVPEATARLESPAEARPTVEPSVAQVTPAAVQASDGPGPLALAASAARVAAEVRIRAAMRRTRSSATKERYAGLDEADPAPSAAAVDAVAVRPEVASGAQLSMSEEPMDFGYEDEGDVAMAWGGPEFVARQDAAHEVVPLRPRQDDADFDADEELDQAAGERPEHSSSGYVRRNRIARGYSMPRLSRSKRPGAVPGL